MNIQCNYKYRLQDTFFFIIASIIIWNLISIFTYSVFLKVFITICIIILIIQKTTQKGPISLKICEDSLIAKKLIGEERINLNKIKDIRKVNWGLRYKEVYILTTENKKMYLNTKCYHNLIDGITLLEFKMSN